MKDYFVYIMTIAAGPCSMSKLDDRGKMSDAGKAERELAAAMFLRRAACHPECKREISPKVVDYTSYLTQSMSS